MNRRTKRNAAKQRRNILMVVALMVVVCVVSVGGTLAWLTDTTEEVANTFTPSNIDLELDETKDDFKMVPGSTIDKDPKVKIGNDVDAYVFVKITASQNPNFHHYLDFAVAEGWTIHVGKAKGEEGYENCYEWVYYREVGKDAETKTFSVLNDDKVSVKTTVTKQMMDAITDTTTTDEEGNPTTTKANKPTLTFTAYAIQKDNIEGTSDGKSAVTVAWETINPN